jgi:hypothetical protein
MAERDDRTGKTASPQAQELQGGYEGNDPGYGRGYGRDFGGGGRNQGFDGSWGQGYGGSVAPSDYREGFGGEAYGGGMAASDYERSNGGRGEEFGSDDRSWIDRCADDASKGRTPHHRGRGPKSWARSDQRLYEEVCERLLNDRLIDARGFEVDIEDGVVTLIGRVRAPADPQLAERLVRQVPGVKDVRLELSVTAPGDEQRPEAPKAPWDQDDRVDKSSLTAPMLARRAPPPDSAGAP